MFILIYLLGCLIAYLLLKVIMKVAQETVDVRYMWFLTACSWATIITIILSGIFILLTYIGFKINEKYFK